MLYFFFYEIVSQDWGFDPKHKGCGQVFYFDGDESELYRTEHPADMDIPDDSWADESLPETAITFSQEVSVPDFEEFQVLCDFESTNLDWFDEYDEACGNPYDNCDDDESEITKLLGYANLVQGCMLIECERASNGVYMGTPEGYIKKRR